MIAKVIMNNREFYSHVFAYFNPGFHECVVVYDDEKEKFEMINVYDTKPSLKRKVFIIDTNTETMIEKKFIKLSYKTSYKDCLGYDWILNNVELIKNIKDNKIVEDKFIKLAKELNSNIESDEWTLVKNEKDVKNLMTAAWEFHDSVIANVEYKMKETYDSSSKVSVLFKECWECEILLEFIGDVYIQFSVDDKNIPDILDSNILFNDGYIYWVDDYIEDVKEISEEHIYFRARSLKWKMINKKMDC